MLLLFCHDECMVVRVVEVSGEADGGGQTERRTMSHLLHYHPLRQITSHMSHDHKLEVLGGRGVNAMVGSLMMGSPTTSATVLDTFKTKDTTFLNLKFDESLPIKFWKSGKLTEVTDSCSLKKLINLN